MEHIPFSIDLLPSVANGFTSGSGVVPFLLEVNPAIIREHSFIIYQIPVWCEAVSDHFSILAKVEVTIFCPFPSGSNWFILLMIVNVAISSQNTRIRWTFPWLVIIDIIFSIGWKGDGSLRSLLRRRFFLLSCWKLRCFFTRCWKSRRCICDGFC